MKKSLFGKSLVVQDGENIPFRVNIVLPPTGVYLTVKGTTVLSNKGIDIEIGMEDLLHTLRILQKTKRITTGMGEIKVRKKEIRKVLVYKKIRNKSKPKPVPVVKKKPAVDPSMKRKASTLRDTLRNRSTVSIEKDSTTEKRSAILPEEKPRKMTAAEMGVTFKRGIDVANTAQRYNELREFVADKKSKRK